MTIPAVHTESVLRQVRSAAEESGRDPREITVVAVTKAFPISTMEAAWREGFTVFGESRVQEVIEKIREFKHREETELHLIGHLQKNKVRKAVNLFDVIESVDSYELAEKISRVANEEEKRQRIFLQVNTGRDPAKFGLLPESAMSTAKDISKLSGIILEGLMVIAPLTSEQKILRRVFSETRKLRDRIRESVTDSCRYLSMGMSGDFPLAIREGATHIRVGSALFGERPKW